MIRREKNEGFVPSALAGLRQEESQEDFLVALRSKLANEPVPRTLSPGRRIWSWLQDRPIFVAGLSGALAAAALFLVWNSGALRLDSSEGTLASPSNDSVPQVQETGNPTGGVPELSEPNPAHKELAAIYEVPSAKVAVITLNINSDVHVEDASFVITLPEGVSFWSDGQLLAERHFEWQAPLLAGENEVPVAVRGSQPGDYSVVATVSVNGETFEHKVILRVEAT